MSDLLQTILFGTFVPHDVPSRKIIFDSVVKRTKQMPAPRRNGPVRASVIEVLKRHPSDWLTVGIVAAESGCCDDTAIRVLNKLASDLVISKRFPNGKRVEKHAIFKWMNKNAKKQ